MKFFSTAGAVNPEKHYYLAHRLNEADVRRLIQQEKYFVLHAPRQSGKTTGVIELAKQINQDGKYKALYVNIEAAQAARSKFIDGLRIILNSFKVGIAEWFGPKDSAIAYLERETNNPSLSGNALNEFLTFWAQNSKRPLVLFIDEIDSLVGDTLISVLRQLRAGYTNRPNYFPQAVCLVGVRDLRDYRIWSDAEQSSILGGSAFNIKAESLVLPNFSLEQVRDLYLQHTKETGQKFTDEAIEYAFYLTQGQPWLVNALAYQACFRDVTDYTQPITKEVIERSKEILIKRRDTHLDVLIDRLFEPRVRAIMDIVMQGLDAQDFPMDDISYVIDLGLIRRDQKNLVIANPIYQEVIPRELTYVTEFTMVQKTIWYQNDDKSINIHKLLEAFTQFYRENSDVWLEKFAYKESGPHLLLMAFLQRVINGGGKIHREYALGRRRVDLFVEWSFGQNQMQRIVIELKVKRNEKTLSDGLVQTLEYMDLNNATEGHLVIFDRALGKTWDEKIYQEDKLMGDQTIHVWGL